MGVLELIPYVGPFLGGVLVALFSLPGGLARTLWALGVVIVVQQLEGGMLSPQLMSDATRLHPVAVVLCVMLGGTAGAVSYTHLRAHETGRNLVCRLLLEKKKKTRQKNKAKQKKKKKKKHESERKNKISEKKKNTKINE